MVLRVTGSLRVPAGRWVRIHRVELGPAERAPDIPDDTAGLPFECWINGWLVDDARPNEQARIRTPAGRVVEGKLVALDPGYSHSFGSPPIALQRVGRTARSLLSRSSQR
jgi:hypothetical protein